MGLEEQWILLSIGLCIIIGRIAIRWRVAGPANWQVDDYLMPLTGLIFTAEIVAAYMVGAKFDGLTNSYMSHEERTALDPNSREYYNRQWGSKIQILGWSLYACILWCLKVCVATLYGRLISGLAHLESRVRIAYIMLAVTYVAVALTLLLSCQPFNHFWQVSPDPGALCRPTNSPVYVLVVVIPNIITDAYLLSIPLPLIWAVSISWQRKITLMVLFGGAVFVMLAGIIRAVVILKSGPDGAISGSQWACRETFVAVVVANMPIVYPYLRKLAAAAGLDFLLSKSMRSQSRGIQQSGESHGKVHTAGTRLRSTKRSANNQMSTQNTTAWASDDKILPADDDRESLGDKTLGEITVAQEISVRTEQATGSGPYNGGGAKAFGETKSMISGG
ncbi:hypothetical protein Q7P37_008306 [Cladosporium fusiforme]